MTPRRATIAGMDDAYLAGRESLTSAEHMQALFAPGMEVGSISELESYPDCTVVVGVTPNGQSWAYRRDGAVWNGGESPMSSTEVWGQLHPAGERLYMVYAPSLVPVVR
jgi:hypothetical protein